MSSPRPIARTLIQKSLQASLRASLGATMLFVSLFLFTPGARSSSDDANDQEYYHQFLDYYMSRVPEAIANIDPGNTRCEDCEAHLAGEERAKSRECLATFNQTFDKSTFDIPVLIGYESDVGRDLVVDQVEKRAMLRKLLKACDSPEGGACGFTQPSPDNDPDFLVKKMPIRSADGQVERYVDVSIRLTHCSASESDKWNRGRGKKNQKLQTEYAEAAFYGAIRSGAEFPIYSGHATGGGGPLCEPPLLNDQGRVDYPRYRRDKPGLKKLTSALDAAKTKPKALGVFACDSDRLFTGTLKKKIPNSGIVALGTNVVFASGMSQTFAAIDSMLRMRCKQEFHASLGAVKSVLGRPVDGGHVHNFFKDRPFPIHPDLPYTPSDAQPTVQIRPHTPAQPAQSSQDDDALGNFINRMDDPQLRAVPGSQRIELEAGGGHDEGRQQGTGQGTYSRDSLGEFIDSLPRK